MGVGAGAGGLADFRGDVLGSAASADSLLETAASIESLLLELGLEVVVLDLGLDELRLARADLEVKAATAVRDDLSLKAVLAATADLAKAGARGLLSDFRSYGLNATAVANGILHAAARSGSIDLNRVHRLGFSLSAGRSSTAVDGSGGAWGSSADR